MRFDRFASTCFVLVFSTATAVQLTGCQDSSARERAEVQGQIQQASQKLRKALAGGPADESTAPTLTAIVSDLGRIQGGEPGQQAAKAMLAATAQLELANVRLDAVEAIEANHRAQRRILSERISAIEQLNSDAEALEGTKATKERENLERDLAAAQDQAKQLQQQIEQLDGPMTNQAKLNAESKKQIDELRLKVNELRRNAQELGSADGFDVYKQAVETSRQADKIEYEQSQREIELEYSLAPDYSAADSQAQQVDDMIKTIQEAREQLDALATAMAEQVAANRKQASDLAGLVNAGMAAMEKERSEALGPAYEETLSQLDKAASQAQAAARQSKGDDAQAARMVALQVQQTIGRTQWLKAQGLHDDLSLSQRMNSASISGSGQERITALETAHKEAIEQAKAAYASAQELAGQVQLRNDPRQIEVIQANLQTVTAALEPKPVEPAAPQPGLKSPAELGAVSDTASRGADSPEELATALKSFDSMAALPHVLDLQIPLRHVSGLTPAQRSFGEGMKTFANGISVLDGALRAKFNSDIDAIEDESDGMNKIPSVKDATIQDLNGIHGTILVTLDNGREHKVPITQIDHRWYLGNENQFIDSTGWIFGVGDMNMMGGGGASSNDAMAQQMMQGMLMGMAKAFEAIGTEFTTIAKEVERGDYTSLADFEAKIKDRIKKVAMDAAKSALPNMPSPPK